MPRDQHRDRPEKFGESRLRVERHEQVNVIAYILFRVNSGVRLCRSRVDELNYFELVTST